MLENERSILGSILINNESLYEIYNIITPDMFEHSLYRDCFKEMLALYDSGESITLQTIAQRLDSPERSRTFIAEQLSEILSENFTSSFIKSYAEVLVKDYKARVVKEIFTNINISANTIDDTIGEIMTRLERLNDNRSVKIKSLSQIAEDNQGKYFNETVGTSDIKTGFYNLDESLGGLEPGDLTIIAARPACGKSAFATQVVKNIADKGKKVAYVNLEMSESQIYERFVSHSPYMELSRIKHAKCFLGDEEKHFNEINEKLLAYKNVDVMEDIFLLREIISECKHRNYDVIVIDYLQLIESGHKFGGRNEEVAWISRNLKKFAKKYNCHIIALSQLNRASAGKGDKEPTMAELRESGALEQDASNIIMIWNLNDEQNCVYKGVKTEKTRQSKTVKIGMHFDGAHMSFSERHEEFWKWEKQAKEHAKDWKPADDDDITDMF